MIIYISTALPPLLKDIFLLNYLSLWLDKALAKAWDCILHRLWIRIKALQWTLGQILSLRDKGKIYVT
jgi:hypothetical protein